MTARIRFRARGQLPILVAVAVSLLLAHICALPAAAPTETTGAPGHHAPGDDHPDGAHVASCDATVSTTAKACPQAYGGPGTVQAIVGTAASRASSHAAPSGAGIARTPVSNRSRVLLHAALLI